MRRRFIIRFSALFIIVSFLIAFFITDNLPFGMKGVRFFLDKRQGKVCKYFSCNRLATRDLSYESLKSRHKTHWGRYCQEHYPYEYEYPFLTWPIVILAILVFCGALFAPVLLIGAVRIAWEMYRFDSLAWIFLLCLCLYVLPWVLTICLI